MRVARCVGNDFPRADDNIFSYVVFELPEFSAANCLYPTTLSRLTLAQISHFGRRFRSLVVDLADFKTTRPSTNLFVYFTFFCFVFGYQKLWKGSRWHYNL